MTAAARSTRPPGGRPNGAFARRLMIGEAAVAEHVGTVFDRLDPPVAADDHRRVFAVLAHLRG